jgi:hypothetical protein
VWSSLPERLCTGLQTGPGTRWNRDMAQLSKALARLINRRCQACEERRKKIAAALERVWKRPRPNDASRDPADRRTRP